jgi:DNA (cytosine-5)-methyltransferase 1
MGISSKQSLASISLFSGAMGLDLGLEQYGFKVRVAVELNQAAIGTVKRNRPATALLAKSIKKVSAAEILEAGKLQSSDVFLISAGPCCQSFSTAGKRHSVADPRGNLFYDFCRIVREIKPRFFVMENVKGAAFRCDKAPDTQRARCGVPTINER